MQEVYNNRQYSLFSNGMNTYARTYARCSFIYNRQYSLFSNGMNTFY